MEELSVTADDEEDITPAGMEESKPAWFVKDGAVNWMPCCCCSALFTVFVVLVVIMAELLIPVAADADELFVHTYWFWNERV